MSATKLRRALLSAAIILAVLLASLPALAGITLYPGVPKPGTLQGGTMTIQVDVVSTYDLKTVHAQVDTVGADLTAGTPPSWTGSLSLVGVGRGPKTLVLTATDVLGGVGTTTISFTHDERPTITISAPLAWSVARPSLRLTATCTDDDTAAGCIGFKAVESTSGATLATGVSAIDATVDLSAWDGTAASIVFFAGDSDGSAGTVTRDVYVEGSAALTEVATLGRLVLDVDDGRILYLDLDGSVKIRRRADGTDTVVGTPVLATIDALPNGRLTSTGAIFTARPGTAGGCGDARDRVQVYEWLGTGTPTLVDDSCSGLFGRLSVAGDYALQYSVPTVNLLNLALGYSTPITFPTPSSGGVSGGLRGASLATNGDVVGGVEDPGGFLTFYRFHAGALKAVGTTAFVGGRQQIIDAANIIYNKGDGAAVFTGVSRIAMMGADGSEVDLSGDRKGTFTPSLEYDASGGWVAFVRQNPSTKIWQIWRRSPAGLEEQLTPFGTASTLDAMSVGGDVSFLNMKRYIGVPSGVPLAVGSTLGRSVFLSDGLYVVLGRSALKYSFGVAPGDAGFYDAGTGDAGAVDASDSSIAPSDSALGDTMPDATAGETSIEGGLDTSPPDASPADTSSSPMDSADGTAPPPPSDGGSCAAAPGRVSRGEFVTLLCGLVLLAKRRRRPA